MLFSSSWGRGISWTFFALLGMIFFGLPLLMLVLAAMARQWNGVFPSHLELGNFLEAVMGSRGRALLTSLLTALVATVGSVGLGTWGALAARPIRGMWRRLVDGLFVTPIALPTVTVGLALLVTFSRPPLVLNGTPFPVIMAHIILITAYAYSSINAGLSRLPEAYEQVAAILGGSNSYILWRVTLPLLRPYILAAASLSFAFSMGELGATIMVYPPNWVTAPVDIYALTNRGSIFVGSAMSVLLLGATVAALSLVNRRRGQVNDLPGGAHRS